MTDGPGRDTTTTASELPTSTDVLVVGAGPAGSAAAAWAIRAGHDVVLVDAATFPRDKTCGDGLTPRAVAELDRLGLGEWVRSRAQNRGLELTGFGQKVTLEWPGGSLPAVGAAVPRSELDDRIRRVAVDAGAEMAQGWKAVDVIRNGGRVAAVVVESREGRRSISCRTLIVADGVRSPLGKMLGREWHRDTAFGVAARAYVTSARGDDEWITSHLELRNADGDLQPGYGWVFPLGAHGTPGTESEGVGEVNLGVGTLATSKRPAASALRPLLELYAAQRQSAWSLTGGPRRVQSALLPMGGAVSHVAGPNWAVIGDAAACVNPLNGEGIDYGLEGGRLVAEHLDDPDLTEVWPAVLREHYGQSFSVARRLAGLLTVPKFLPVTGPIGMRSRAIMTVAVKVMGNLITEEDHDVVARAWRAAGSASLRVDDRPPFS